MARRLKLRKSEVVNVDHLTLGAFRLRVDIIDSEGVDTEVFLYRRDPPAPPPDGKIRDIFFAIASPVDMEEYPAGGPDSRTPYPFFRLNYVELDFRAITLADKAYQSIVQQLTLLLTALDKLEALTPTLELWIGGAPEESASDSGSGSSQSM